MSGPTLPLGVKDTVLLEHLGDDGNRGVYRVGNNQHVRFRSGRCDASGKIAYYSSIDLGVVNNQ